MPRKKKKPFNRLPNGFGSIKKLSGNRRKPYYVCGPESRVHGVKIPGEKIGSAETWEEGYQMLALWWAEKEKRTLPDKQKGSITPEHAYTFAQVYEMFYKEKYELSLRTYSKSSRDSTRAAFKNCSSLHDTSFYSLGYKELQENIDFLATRDKPLKHASLELVLNLYHEMYRYALKFDMAEKDYSKYVEIRIPDDDEKGEPLTPEELEILWQHTDIPEIQAALIICYSGWRISEFINISIDLDNMTFYGGMKTDAGKGRTVPIHPRILPVLHDYMWHPIKYADAYRKSLYQALTALGVLYYSKDGNRKKHTPHDFRHTFSWLCDTYGVDSLSKRIMMGHSLGKDVTDKVYGHRTLEQLRTEIEKIQ